MKRPSARLLSGALGVVVVVGAFAALSTEASAQGTVHAATLQADLATTPGVVHVRVAYELVGVAPGALVPVSVLDFGDAVGEGFRVGRAGALVELRDRHGAARTGTWPVESGPEGRSVLRVEYDVPRTVDSNRGRVVSHLPVLWVDLPPEAARPGLFQGQVRVPAGWDVSEGFPTGLRGGGDGEDLYSVELAVVPSVVTLRARLDGRSPFGLPLVLDLVAVSALVVTAVAGWRHLREPVR